MMDRKPAEFSMEEESVLEGIRFGQPDARDRLMALLEKECRSYSEGKRYFPISIAREACRNYLKRVTLEQADKLIFNEIFADAIVSAMANSGEPETSRLGALLHEMIREFGKSDSDRALLLRLYYILGLAWDEIQLFPVAKTLMLTGEAAVSALEIEMVARGVSPAKLLEQNLRPRGEVTQLLEDVRDGRRPIGDVVAHEHAKLRRQAQHLLRLEGKGISWQADDLVNEMFLRMPKQADRSPINHMEFEALARRIMRHVLIDRARKPIPGQGRFSEELREDISASPIAMEDQLAWRRVVEVVEEVIRDLRRSDPESAEMLYATLYRDADQSHLAKLHGVSVSTVKRRIKEGRNRIRRRLGMELKQ